MTRTCATIVIALVLAAPAAAGFDEGLAAYQNEEFAAAKAEWAPLAAAGDADAQYYLGLMHAKGQGYPRSREQAVAWFRRAAERGHHKAQNNLGSYYLMGFGVEQSDEEAVRWFRKSAEQGHSYAQYNLGRMYREGDGVPQDDLEAFFWFSLSAAQGVPRAIEERDRLAQELTDEQLREVEERYQAWRPTRPLS